MMQFVYDEDSVRFVRGIQAELVRNGGFAYAAGIEEHLLRLEEDAAESILSLLREWQELLESDQTESFIKASMLNSESDSTRADGLIFLKLLLQDRQRFEPRIREVFARTLSLLQLELSTGLVNAPMPLNLIATVRYLYEICVVSRTCWNYTQNYFKEEHGTSLAVAVGDGNVLFDSENPLVPLEAEVAFWELLDVVQSQFNISQNSPDLDEVEPLIEELPELDEEAFSNEGFDELMKHVQQEFGGNIVAGVRARVQAVAKREFELMRAG